MRKRSFSRRDLLKSAGIAASISALPAVAGAQSTASTNRPLSGLPEPPSSPYPSLNQRTLGWLRFLWEKSTTPDDWTSNGVPHPWWDRYTAPVVLSYGRFDLSFCSYGIIMMADQTPAWREVYTRITDELAKRYPTYWGAIDWLTQIGDDPKRAKYPQSIMATLPPNLRGNYNRFGWTANAVQPWGLQKDPIGSDGYLFFRGWFHLLLSTYKYVSGDDKWTQPFKVVGYGDEEFEWDHHRLAARLEEQYRAHSEGPQCENTKVWFYCNTAAALGMYLYDKVYNKQTHRSAENFLDYARKNYVGVSGDGKLEWVTQYYDPLVGFKYNGPPAGGLATAFLLAPQNRDFASFLYEAAVNAAGYRTANSQPRANSGMLLMARELGDAVVAEKLKAAADRESDPRFFGKQNEMFGWWTNYPTEGYPRGQASATLMVSEIGRPGDWIRALQTPFMDKFAAPTVEGVDFPAMGLYQAWNDSATATLNVGTFAASPDKRGATTSFRVTGLPATNGVAITLNGQPFRRFEVTGPNTIRIDTTIDSNQFRIETGYRGAAQRADTPVVAGSGARSLGSGLNASFGGATNSKARNLFSTRSIGCACCSA